MTRREQTLLRIIKIWYLLITARGSIPDQNHYIFDLTRKAIQNT